MAWLSRLEEAKTVFSMFSAVYLVHSKQGPSLGLLLAHGSMLVLMPFSGSTTFPFHICPKSGQLSLHITVIYAKEHPTYHLDKLPFSVKMGSLLVFSDFLIWLHKNEFGRNPLNFWYMVIPYP